MYQEKFTEKEWETIAFAPLWGFALVAGADGKIESAEVAILAKELAEASLYKDPLVREVLSMIAGSLDTTFPAFLRDSRNSVAGLVEAATLLETKLDAGVGDPFKRVVLAICAGAAKATSKRRKKVSKANEAAFVMVAASLRVPLN